MEISVTEAKAKLTDLVRRAKAGDEVVLTRHGRPEARIVPAMPALSPGELRARRRTAINRAVREAAARGGDRGASAARSQDFLYGEDGLPA